MWSYLSVCSSWQSGKPRSIIATAIVLSSRIHDRLAFSLDEYVVDSYILLLIFLCTFCGGTPASDAISRWFAFAFYVALGLPPHFVAVVLGSYQL